MIELVKDYHKQVTDLCLIMKKRGSDKGLGWHNYTTLYSILFNKIRDNPISFFEVGLGTNNIYIPSNMGLNGIPGASLKGWKEYFSNKNTMIYGADIDRNILFQEENIKTFYTDQLNSQSIREMWEKIPEEMDVILDDGLHTFDANWNFLLHSIHKLKKGGIYIIEDLLKDTVDKFNSKLNMIKSMFNPSFIEVINIPHETNLTDNNVFILIL